MPFKTISWYSVKIKCIKKLLRLLYTLSIIRQPNRKKSVLKNRRKSVSGTGTAEKYTVVPKTAEDMLFHSKVVPHSTSLFKEIVIS